jgi:hypothetical protein
MGKNSKFRRIGCRFVNLSDNAELRILPSRSDTNKCTLIASGLEEITAQKEIKLFSHFQSVLFCFIPLVCSVSFQLSQAQRFV